MKINKTFYIYKPHLSISENSLNIKKILEKKNICIVKNYNKNIYIKIFDLIKKKFSNLKEKRISGPFTYKMKDFKRFDIGDRAKNPRFARFITFFEWNRNEEFYKVIDPYIKLRNEICNYKKINFEYFPTKKKYFKWCDLIRVIQYPIGGGFLHRHNDKDPENLDTQINLLIPITTKTNGKISKFKTFNKGGLYYFFNKKKINIENFVNSGDLIFHNLNIDHGVNSIDDDKKLELNKLTGRISLNFSVGKFFIF